MPLTPTILSLISAPWVNGESSIASRLKHGTFAGASPVGATIFLLTILQICVSIGM